MWRKTTLFFSFLFFSFLFFSFFFIPLPFNFIYSEQKARGKRKRKRRKKSIARENKLIVWPSFPFLPSFLSLRIYVMIVSEWNRRNICEDLNENELWINVDSLIYAADSGLSSSGITLRQTNLTTVVVTKLAYSIFLSPSFPLLLFVFTRIFFPFRRTISLSSKLATPLPLRNIYK